MKVELIAQTKLAQASVNRQLGYLEGGEERDADTLAEFAGRACYQSWDKPNPATRENRDYLANIRDQGHFSVLEHASATFYVQGVSRALTHELIRHRHLSFSQLSQRFVDESSVDFVVPPGLRGRYDEVVLQRFESTVKSAYKALVWGAPASMSRKQVREMARCVLPNATETKIVVTGNHRAWREFMVKRNSEHADAEIRELAQAILVHLKRIAPNTFEDM